MKKTKIFLTILLAAFILCAGILPAKATPKSKPFYFHSGQNGLPKNYIELIDVGVDLFSVQFVAHKEYAFNPWKGTKNYKYNFGGWNEDCFARTKDIIDKLSKHNARLAIIIDGSPRRRNTRHSNHNQWSNHLFNFKNGGMIKESNGVAPFYTNKDSKILIFSLFDEIIKRFGKNSIIIVFNWELFNGFNGGGGDIAAALAVKYSDTVMFGIGTPYSAHNKYVSEKSNKKIFSLLEGSTPRGWKEKYTGAKPGFKAISFGYWAKEIEAYGNKNDTTKAAYYESWRYKLNAADIIEAIHNGWRWGYYMGLPFEQKMKRTPHMREIGADPKYPFWKQNEIIFNYLKEAIPLAKERKKKKLKRYTNKYIKKIKE